MANENLQKYFPMSKEVTAIYNELDQYLEFCKAQGYVFDESHLGNEKTPWGEWQRVKAGKHPKDNWSPFPKEKREFKPRDRIERTVNWKAR